MIYLIIRDLMNVIEDEQWIRIYDVNYHIVFDGTKDEVYQFSKELLDSITKGIWSESDQHSSCIALLI